jgi:membrane protease YdiL (CAAX protease family)
MKKAYNKTIILTSVLLLLVIIIVHFILPANYSPTLLPIALVLFSVSSFFSFGIFQKILNRSPQQFINYYIAFSFLKMIIQLFLLIILALIIRSEAVALILWYCILFAVYVTIETVYALKLAKKE